MPDKGAPPDLRIAELARRQHGVVTSKQLLETGLSRNAVLERRRAGRLHSLHRGVYAVGHVAPSAERRWMAAVLALGVNAALSHRSAAELWGLLPAGRAPVDVSLPGRNGRRQRSGIRVHRPVSLVAAELTQRRGILVTVPSRTIADLRSVVTKSELRRAIRQADFLGFDIGSSTTLDRTRSELERRFLRLCRRHRLPVPAVNTSIGAMTVDFCWPDRKLIVETDGYIAHRGRQAFEDDRARDLRLKGLGYEVLRLSYRQVSDEPAQVVAILREAFGRGAHSSRPT